MHDGESGILFSEKQRLSSMIVWAIALSVAIACGFLFFALPPDQRLEGVLACVAAVLVIGLPLQLVVMYTVVDRDGIRVRVSIFGKKALSFRDIASVSRYDYSPISDFGGWGVRSGVEGRMYSARGDVAIDVRLKSGEHVFIGTQKPDQFLTAVRPHLSAA